MVVNIRITHPKKLAAEHRVIMTSGVIGQEAPATLDAGSDPVGQTTAARTRLAVSGYRHRAICLRLGHATRQIRHLTGCKFCKLSELLEVGGESCSMHGQCSKSTRAKKPRDHLHFV